MEQAWLGAWRRLYLAALVLELGTEPASFLDVCRTGGFMKDGA